MKNAILLLMISCQSVFCLGQTTATDFTATDCNSNSHTLFTELDNGKVVVLAWIMPCLTCVAPVKTAYNIAKAYNAKPEYAGRVKFYLIDDLADQNCSYLANWASNNNIGPANMDVFENAPSGDAIDEDNYGGTGMPHICIVGGTSHKIFFNKFNDAANDPSGIESAIFNALTPASTEDLVKGAVDYNLYPNPARGSLHLDFTLQRDQTVGIDVFDVVGKKVLSDTRSGHAGKNNEVINVNALQPGVYNMHLKTGNAKAILQFTISK